MEERFDFDIDRRIERLLKSHEEFRKRQEKTDEQLRKTDEQIKELGRKQEKTDEQLRKTDEQLRKTDEQIKELGRKQEKTDEQLRKTDEEIRKVNRQMAGLTDGWGRLTEGFALASVEEIFNGIGIPIKTTFARPRSRKDGRELELDLLSIGKKDEEEIVIAIEVKTYLRVKDVDDFLKDISDFYEFFEEYRRIPLITGIAFMNHSRNVRLYAERYGIYLFSLGEDVMTLVNSKGFKPKIHRYKE